MLAEQPAVVAAAAVVVVPVLVLVPVPVAAAADAAAVVVAAAVQGIGHDKVFVMSAHDEVGEALRVVLLTASRRLYI